MCVCRSSRTSSAPRRVLRLFPTPYLRHTSPVACVAMPSHLPRMMFLKSHCVLTGHSEPLQDAAEPRRSRVSARLRPLANGCPRGARFACVRYPAWLRVCRVFALVLLNVFIFHLLSVASKTMSLALLPFFSATCAVIHDSGGGSESGCVCVCYDYIW